MNATCNGCDGVAHSGVVFDYCCSCGGDAGYDDACYHDLLYEGEFSETPFDPYTSSHALYFTEEGKRTIDECGECRGVGIQRFDVPGVRRGVRFGVGSGRMRRLRRRLLHVHRRGDRFASRLRTAG